MPSSSASPASPGSAASADDAGSTPPTTTPPDTADRQVTTDRPDTTDRQGSGPAARRPGGLRRRVRRGRSRLPQHGWSVFFSLGFVPVSLWLVGLLPPLSVRVVDAAGTGEAAVPVVLLVLAVLAASTLGWLLGWSTAVFSSLTAWLYAGAWLAVSLLAGPLGRADGGALLSRSLDGLHALAQGGTAAAITVVVAGVSVGTSLARRGGRSDERAEAATGRESPRRRDHVLAGIPALLLAATATWLLAGALAGRTGHGWDSPPLLLGAGLLAGAALTIGLSSLGAQVAGAALTAVALLHTTILGTGPAPVVLDPAASSTPFADGSLLAVGIVLGMGASGAHWARRSGKRWERTEMAIEQVSRSRARPAGRAARRTR